MKHFWNICFLLFTALAPGSFLRAQANSPFKYNAWQYWGPASGLPQSFVNAIAEDAYGRLWIGTQAGISLFDGEEFHTWGALQGLSGGDVRTLYSDPAGNQIWIAMTGNTLFTMNMRDFSLRKVDSLHQVRGLLRHKSGMLAATDAGVFRIVNKSLLPDPINLNPETTNKVRCLVAGGPDRWFMGFETSGLWEKTGAAQENAWLTLVLPDWPGRTKTRVLQANTRRIWSNPQKSDKKDSVVYALCFRNDRLWAACGDSLFQWRGDKLTAVPRTWKHERITTLLEDNSGKLWIGTKTGLFLYDPGKPNTAPRFVTRLRNLGVNVISQDRTGPWWSSRQNGAAPLEVNVIFQDRTGTIWVGTKEGLYALLDGRQLFTTPALHANVYSLTPDPLYPEYLWVGTWEQGFQRMNLADNEGLTSVTYKNIPNEERRAPRIVAIEKEIWVGTAKGIFRIRDREKSIPWITGRPEIGGDINTRYMFVSKRNKALWVIDRNEPSDHLLRFPIENGKPVNCPETFHPNIGGLRTFIEIPADSALWIGTERGLYRIPAGSTPDSAFFRHHEPLLKGFILALHVSKTAPDTLLWVGTKSEGLVAFSTKSRQVINRWNTENSTTLPDNSIYSIGEDKYGRLWLGTNKGLTRFRRQANWFATFGTADDIPHEYNINAFAEVGDTALWFGGVGVAGFVPMKPKIDPARVLLFLIKETEDVPYNRRTWSPVDSAEFRWFSPDNKWIKLIAISPNYADPSRSALRFTLVKKTWLGFGKTDIIATFSGHTYLLPALSLQPFGIYRLYIESAEAVIEPGGPEPFNLRFTIGPSPTRIVEFFVIVLLLLGFAFWWWQDKQQRVLEKATMQAENDRLRYSVLSSQMKPHFISNMFKVLASDDIEPEKQRAFAQWVSSVARSWLDATEEGKKGAVSLEDDRKVLADYVSAMKIRYDMEQIEWEVHLALSGMEAKDLKIPVLFLQPYIENAIVHGLRSRFREVKGTGGKLCLRAFVEERYLCIELKDNGGGMTKEVEAWLNTGEPIKRDGNGHKSKSLEINRERVKIINRLNPAPGTVNGYDAILLDEPKNYGEPDNPRGVVVTIRLRRDLLEKGYLGQ